jgi:hypothetical protein
VYAYILRVDSKHSKPIEIGSDDVEKRHCHQHRLDVLLLPPPRQWLLQQHAFGRFTRAPQERILALRQQ